MGLGLRITRRNGRVTVGDLGTTAITMVQHDHGRDIVQLDRRREVVPKGLVPAAELRSDCPDGGSRHIELTVPTQHRSSSHVIERELGKARIDAGEQHGTVVPRHGAGTRRQ